MALPGMYYAAYPGTVQGTLPRCYPAGPIVPSLGIWTRDVRVILGVPRQSLSSDRLFFFCSCPLQIHSSAHSDDDEW